MKIKSSQFLFLLATILAVHLVWISANYLFEVRDLFIPNIFKTYSTFFNLFKSNQFWFDLSASIYRVFAGFVLSLLVAYPITMATIINERSKTSILYLIEFFRYLPIPVFIPLTILWFGVGDNGKIFIIFLGTFAQMIPLFFDSAIGYKTGFSSMQASLRWDSKRILSKVIIPGSAPAIWDNSRVCLGWAWTYLVIAELLGAENGLGYSIIRSQRYLATDRIFAYIIVIGLIGVLSDRAMVYFRKRLFKWY